MLCYFLAFVFDAFPVPTEKMFTRSVFEIGEKITKFEDAEVYYDVINISIKSDTP